MTAPVMAATAILFGTSAEVNAVLPERTPPKKRLMRLAGDPLLLREFLLRKDTDGPVPSSSLPITGEVSVALASGALALGQLQSVSGGSNSRFEKREPLLEPSIAPSVFEPSRRDREESLDLKELRSETVGLTTGSTRTDAALVASFIGFTLLSIWLFFVPD